MQGRVLQLSMFAEESDEGSARMSGAECVASLPEDLDGLSDDELLAAAADARRLTSWAQARELAAVAELHRRRARAEESDPGPRILDAHASVCQEVSAALAVTPHNAAVLVDLADRLDTTLPGTRQAFEAGRIDRSKALVLAELTEGLDLEVCRHLEATVLPTADRRTTGQLRRRIRDLVKRLAPERLRERKRDAVRGRCLEVWDEEYSGTSTLTVHGLDPAAAHGTFNRITAAAKAIKAEGDPRTLHQLRADLAHQLLHGHVLPEAVHRVQTSASADDGPEADTVPGTARTGGTGGGAAADHGMSAVDAASDVIAALIADMTDRELTGLRDRLKSAGRSQALPFRVARAVQDVHDRLADLRESWCRAHDPAHGRAAYRPTGSLRRSVEARHATCAFPTCNQRSSRCDLDHTIPWGRGRTCQCNLAPLCRKHHRAKQTPGWRLLQPWPGLLIWVTPSGNWHITLPTRE
jgi:hypothetical protein